MSSNNNKLNNSNVIDFSKKRRENIEKKKRQFERVLFGEFVGCYTEVAGKESLFSLKMIDVSESGCQLEVEQAPGVEQHFTQGLMLSIRMYFTKKSYLPADVKVMRSQLEEVGGREVWRVGCEFDQNLPSYRAIKGMVNFLYLYAEHSQVENRDQRVFFL